MDPRKILGVDANASPEEIQRAYRDQAKKHHPDMGGDSWAFQQVQDAYHTLTNPEPARPKTAKSNPTPTRPRSQEVNSGANKPPSSEPQPGAKRQPPSNASNKNARKQSPQGHSMKLSWKNLMVGQLPLQTETTVFILINCLDIFMTYSLLSTTRGAVESNPIAAYFMNHWGFQGAIAFKLAIVAFVTVIAQIVAIRKITAARFLLWAGSILVGGVVIYSAMLFIKHTF